MGGAAAGFGALGFWIFIAAIVVAGIWYDARRKESQQETLRRVVESGRDIDPVLIDRLVGASDAKQLERDLKVSAYIVGAVAPGLFILSLLLSFVNREALYAVMGTSFLVAFVGAGLYFAARLVERRYADK